MFVRLIERGDLGHLLHVSPGRIPAVPQSTPVLASKCEDTTTLGHGSAVAVTARNLSKRTNKKRKLAMFRWVGDDYD